MKSKLVYQTAFDKDTSESYYNFKKTSFNPYTIIVSKVGYETYYEKRSILSKNITGVITLKTATPLMINAETGKTYVKLDTSNLTNREMVLDGELII